MGIIDSTEKLVKVLSWIKIALSPIILGAIIGGIIYANKPDTTGLLIAAFPAVAGIIGGVFLAMWVSKKHGVTEFHPGLRSTPDWDEMDRQKKQ
ncbi:MAG: hypothetical protein IT236_13135 [Bacteroidia bacterium]|nr:hypothetical protein [Bacteroidia bacterium]